jgi:hypothetical protein
MRKRSTFTLSILVWLGTATVAHAQDPILRVVSLDGVEHPITAQAWSTLPRTSVQAIDHDGKGVKFDGVAARDVLKLVDAPLGPSLRGKNLTVYVVAEAADGYRAVYALAEFDADFTDRVILIADRRDGQALAEKEGQLRIVMPGEKRQARWLRELVSIGLKRAP